MVEVKNEEVTDKRLLADDKFNFLYIKQVPKPTWEEFNKLAEESFGGHRGFALKALMDQLVVFKQVVSEERINELDERLVVVERLLLSKVDDDLNDKVVRKGRLTVGGKEIVGE